MKIYLAGVMQGSIKGKGIQEQNYRQILRAAIIAHYPHAEIVDPFTLFPDSVTYDAQRAKETLFALAAEAASAQIVIAYLPVASMGTAMEMIRAYDMGKAIISISPMKENWVINSLSTIVFTSLDDFCAWVNPTNLAALTEMPAQ